MALYHQYRPSTFDTVVGQTAITQTLSQQVKNNTVGHAYLFFGPRGVGKTSTARILAKVVNCEKPKDANPCNDCASCVAIQGGTAMDIIEIDAASHTGVDHVREHIIEQAQFQPSLSSHRVFIVDEAHMLSTSACNALLKTLEEPPARTIFILATTELQKLPATVVSRCQRMTFARVSVAEMTTHLTHICKDQKREVDAEVLEHIAHVSEGCVRDAVSLLEQILTIDEKKISKEDAIAYLPASYSKEAADILDAILLDRPTDALSAVRQLHDDGVRIDHVFDDLIRVGRERLLASPSGVLVTLLDEAIKRRKDVAASPVVTLPLELLIVSMTAQNSSKLTAPASPNPEPTQQSISSASERKPAPAQKTEVVQDEHQRDPQQPHAAAPPSGSLTSDEVSRHWPAVMQAISEKQPSLNMILGQASVTESNGGISLAIASKFHADRLNQAEMKRVIMDAAANMFGKTVVIDIVVTEQTQPTPSDTMASLASALGGDLV